MSTIARPLVILFALAVLIALLGLGAWGAHFWINITFRPDAQIFEVLELEGIGDVQVQYPKYIQLNNNDEEQIKLLFEPSPAFLHVDIVTISLQALQEMAKYLELRPEQAQLSLSSQTQEITIIKNDLDRPPTSIDVVITASTAESKEVTEQVIKLSIDNISWRIAALLAIIGGIGSILTIVVALKSVVA